MNKIEQYVATQMIPDTRRQVIVDYDTWSDTGSIGQCTLRDEARKLATYLYGNNAAYGPPITTNMKELYVTVCRYYADAWLNHIDAGNVTSALLQSHNKGVMDEPPVVPSPSQLWGYVDEFIAAVGAPAATNIGIDVSLVAALGEDDSDSTNGYDVLMGYVDSIIQYGRDHEVDWTPSWYNT